MRRSWTVIVNDNPDERIIHVVPATITADGDVQPWGHRLDDTCDCKPELIFEHFCPIIIHRRDV